MSLSSLANPLSLARSDTGKKVMEPGHKIHNVLPSVCNLRGRLSPARRGKLQRHFVLLSLEQYTCLLVSGKTAISFWCSAVLLSDAGNATNTHSKTDGLLIFNAFIFSANEDSTDFTVQVPISLFFCVHPSDSYLCNCQAFFFE